MNQVSTAKMSAPNDPAAGMDLRAILDFLPHRYPFLLVDRVTRIDVGKSIDGYKNVSANEPFFNGHFPGNPVMPGVLIIEAIAQLAGVLAFLTLGHRPSDGYIYYLAGTDRTRFRRLVVPGDRLDMHAKLLTARHGTMKFECEARVDGAAACRTDLLCVERRT
jgi:3-hydroxyacyl-[acyl-carrier-protein] dehydratase